MLAVRWALIIIALLGHLGFWVFVYNRVNATGWQRRWVKLIEKAVCIPSMILIPIGIGILNYSALLAWLAGAHPVHLHPLSACYFGFAIACFAILAPFWIASRTWLAPPACLLSEKAKRVEVRHEENKPIFGDFISKTLGSLPLNEVLKVELTEKQIRVPRWPKELSGLRIGHLSDIHFTGKLTPHFYRPVFEASKSWRPDLWLITGDVIDEAHCLGWIDDLLSGFDAQVGKFFVLGNHDRLLPSPKEARLRLSRAGWHDVGSKIHQLSIRGQTVLVGGNERPWFGVEPSFADCHSPERDLGMAVRIGLSHAPDQIEWAREEEIDLLFAGHTHGGQIRFPLIGPVIAPSWYGSQFASGVFDVQPTIMHVSRGLAGADLIRWRCPPEVSLIEVVSGQ